MCGRFNIIDDPLTRLLMEITGRAEGWSITTEYNVAPTEQVPVLRWQAGDWTLDSMRWWLTPSWSDGPGTKYSMFNAKSETLAKSRAYREPFASRRCIVPAAGYYEWKKQGSAKVPFYIEPADAPAFAFAGLWDCWQGESGDLLSCTIVTAAAPVSMQGIHHRIPVHLANDEARAWVNPQADRDELQQLLAPEIRMDLRVTPVSTYVNNARNKDARCVEPLGDMIRIEKD